MKSSRSEPRKDLERLHARLLPLLQAAEREIERRINDALKAIPDAYLLRARIERPRIKSPKSLLRKAAERRWKARKALSNASDVVGHRIVCNNLQDVLRVADLLRETFERDQIPVKIVDHVRTPTSEGYRALHLEVRLARRLDTEELLVGCEIQLRSLLQDAWARLSRADIYKDESHIEPSLLAKMRELSDRLAEIDNLADEVRVEIARPRKGEKGAAHEPPGKEAIAFIFRRAFGQDAPDYALQLALKELGGIRARSDGLDAVVRDTELRARLVSAYSERTGWKPDSLSVFGWLVRAYALGQADAEQAVHDDAKVEKDEVDTIWRRETLSCLPADWREFVERPMTKHDDSSGDLFQVAEALGVASECFCGEQIVDSWGFAEAFVDHYGLIGRKAEAATSAVLKLIWETVGGDECPVHGNAT